MKAARIRFFFWILLVLAAATACAQKPVEPAVDPNTTNVAVSNKVKLAIAEWEPYSGDALSGKGFMTQIAVEALKRMGYETEVSVLPWPRAVELTKRGEQDALLGASLTEERKQWFSYPNVTWNAQIVFYTKAGGNTTFESVEKLAPAKVGGVNETTLINGLSDVPGLTLDPVDVLDQNIEKLANGRIDYFIETKEAVQYVLKMRMYDYSDKIAVMSPMYYEDPLYVVFSLKNPNHAKLTEDYNKGLEAIKADGTFDKILKEYGLMQ